MKKYCLLLCCLPALSVFAQQQDGKKTFSVNTDKKAVITAHLDHLPNDTLVALYEPYSGEFDTVRVKNHGFTLHMPLPKGGSIYVLKIGDAEINMGNTKIVYVEDGQMNIVGKEPGLDKAKVSGSKWVKEWEEAFAMVDAQRGPGKKLFDLNENKMKAYQVGDEDAYNAYGQEIDSLKKIQKTKILEWIRKNPNSGVAGYLITCFITPLPEIDSLIAGLGEHARSSRIVQRHLHYGQIDEAPISLKANTAEEGDAQFSTVATGKPAPDFSIPDVDGKIITLADFKGKYVLLDFWASWCGPCKPQIPFLKAAKDKFQDKNLVVLGVSLDSKKDAWMKAIESHQLNWTNASSLKGWAEPVAQAYGASAIPFNVLIGPDGKILAKGLYGEEIDKKLSEIIK
ncbi:TlpA disulfide reductase family protein [Chitinophaga sp.]|uniref:TlpA disulfide reductase family protein n=1 Tax=Chitinophaga sp. TaxID=1869181 RepID=UPI002F9336E4